MPFSCLLSLSTDPRHFFLHFGATKNIKDFRMKKNEKTHQEVH
jgi:hypothetical protein